jgi:hypothetical protein
MPAWFTENTTGISLTNNIGLKASKRIDHTKEFYLLGYNGFIYCLLYASLFLCLLFNPENGSDIFFRNVTWLSTDYKALYSRRQNASQPPLLEPQILQWFLRNCSLGLYDNFDVINVFKSLFSVYQYKCPRWDDIIAYICDVLAFSSSDLCLYLIVSSY